MDVIQLTQDLVRFPTITPKDEGCFDFLQNLLENKGFKCHRLSFGPEEKRVDNLYARFGVNSPNLCFAGHVDVVPPGQAELWTHNPFDPIIDNGRMYGRGTSDMKGGVAAFIIAALEHIQNSTLNGSISFLLTCDEEGPALYGTQEVLKWLEEKGEKLDACLVGEPSNPSFLGEMIKVGRRGTLSCKLKLEGKQGHVAYPQLANNPIPRLLKILNTVQALKFDEGTEDFDPTHLEITNFDVGNPTTNIIPKQASAMFNIRYTPLHTRASLIKYLEELIYSLEPQAQIVWEGTGEAFLTNKSSLTDTLLKAIENVIGKEPILSTTGGTSDARFITKYCPVIEFGLLNKTIHQIDENVDIQDLKDLKDIYKEFINLFFSR
jgi:succinyl-diaminopimelate desuccinylase